MAFNNISVVNSLFIPVAKINYLYVFTLSAFSKKIKIKELLVFIFTQIPLLYLSTFPGINNRALQLSWLNQIAHTPTAIIREFGSQYLAYLSPANLFWYPDPDLQRSLPLLSVFYSWQAIPYLLGLWWLKKSFKSNFDIFVLYLLFPLSAALTKDPFSTLRALLLYIPLTILIVVGMRKLSRWGFIILIVVSVFWLSRSLFVLLPQERKIVWNAGYKELFTYLNEQDKSAVIDVDKPVYILNLFYNKVDPRLVQSVSPHFQNFDYYKNLSWSNYWHNPKADFRPLVWKDDVCRDQLIVGTDLLISENQAREHFLDFKAKFEPNLVVYSTNPLKKCKIR